MTRSMSDERTGNFYSIVLSSIWLRRQRLSSASEGQKDALEANEAEWVTTARRLGTLKT